MTELKTFDKLYKKTSTGAIYSWQISVYEHSVNNVCTVVSKYGQVDGKIQESTKMLRAGKNVGKSNETTISEHALSVAESDFKKHLKNGYVRSISDATNGSVDAIIEGGVFPMLAHVFSKQGHKIKFPAIAQPKLDGNRCTSQKDDDSVSLWSRKRREIKSLPHIANAINNSNIIDRLDGELYNHDYKDKFEELNEFIKPQSPVDGHEVVQYHVYDIILEDKTNIERIEILNQYRDLFKNTPIVLVESLIVNDEDELMEAFEHFIKQGYEGCMVRNFDGKYVLKRSYDLQKIKEFDDAEFKITGIKISDNGRMTGKAIFICELPDNETFDVKLKGSMDKLEEYANNPSLVVGKMLTVQFQGYTKYGKPRFPVGLRFREDI